MVLCRSLCAQVSLQLSDAEHGENDSADNGYYIEDSVKSRCVDLPKAPQKVGSVRSLGSFLNMSSFKKESILWVLN